MVKFAECKVECLDHMGSDKTVVNAARVSFSNDSTSSFFEAGDEKLIAYLAKHQHWSPFAHTSIQFKCKAPIFLTRQLAKHQVGGAWNEVSRRYVDFEPEFWKPEIFRGRSDSAKQGSAGEIQHQFYARDVVVNHTRKCVLEYEKLLECGVAPEQARIVLPLNSMTEWIWTGSLYFWARVCRLRLEEHAQKEAQDFAKMISSHCENLFYFSWKELLHEDCIL